MDLATVTGARAPLELTLRGVLLGGAITLLFTAANVYLGLKIGLTFATSIPAAVISMAILRFFPSSTIYENNIVQTVASAAGTLAAIIFVLPGLVMIGWWTGFPYVTTAAITMTGGILGVMFSVPLRRALVVDSPELPYPEGRAAAEVLKVGAESREGGEESAKGLKVILVNALAAAGFAVLTRMRLAAEEGAAFFKAGAGSTGIIGGLQFALIGAGHLVGLTVGLAILTGVVIGWWIALPILSAGVPGAAEEVANTVFRSDVRFLGAGTIGVAAIWTLFKIIGPVAGGIRSSLAASRAARGGAVVAVGERDLPIGVIGLVSLGTLFPIAWLLWSVLAGGPLEASAGLLIAGSLVFVLVLGLVIASVCGYMAGLIGASNSPVSGIGILSIVAASLMLVGMFGRDLDPGTTQALVAYALIVTGIVFGVATISNDNLQDLKTGQLIGATPWKQQVALVLGVIFGSLVIPPVLSVLNASFGFAGVPGASADALPAPQAALISSLAKGVLGGDLRWDMIGIGALIGAGVILIDEVLARTGTKLRLPPLAVGLGIYLPMGVTLTVVLGAVLGWFYDRAADRARDPEFVKRMGVLMATGMIVGDSLFGVLYAGIVYETGSDAPLAVTGPDFAPYALAGGTLAFLVITASLYAYTRRKAR
ncbi:OPT family oligopeptide transporter [Sphingomonas xinjiangensis]|uniref:Putative OPT family oligopeptide transporter n=1 Tax=Sphingomonas xinjiangensis TaxID=643568 RepID=A0A840YIG9_9SPHN|nr:oligopeptide transporter, OPT family [Sphingomonas xinjiangensis]MBB5712235.1 putative OPT family oligopeptide transporter [Sphingomonas xinjiangensis]